MNLAIMNDTDDIVFSTDESVDNTAFIHRFAEYLEANPEDPIMDEIRQEQKDHARQDLNSEKVTEDFDPQKKAI